MKKFLILIFMAILVLAIRAFAGGPSQQFNYQPVIGIVAVTPISSNPPTNTFTATPSNTPTPSFTPTVTPTGTYNTATATNTATSTATSTITNTPTATIPNITFTPTSTPTPLPGTFWTYRTAPLTMTGSSSTAVTWTAPFYPSQFWYDMEMLSSGPIDWTSYLEPWDHDTANVTNPQNIYMIQNFSVTVTGQNIIGSTTQSASNNSLMNYFYGQPYGSLTWLLDINAWTAAAGAQTLVIWGNFSGRK